MPKSRSYEQELTGYLQDPERAVAYLNVALEEGDLDLFLSALQNVAKAKNKGDDVLEQPETMQSASTDSKSHQLFFLLKELGLGLKLMEVPKAQRDRVLLELASVV